MRRFLPLLALVLLAGCVPDWATAVALTPDGTPYDMTGSVADGITWAAPATAGSNEREAVFVTGSPKATNQRVCATWLDGIDTQAQPGLMLRWDGTYGVSLTKNVIYGDQNPVFYTTINIHTWDMTVADPQARYTQVAQFPFLAGLRMPDDHPMPGPWRACASVTGPTLTFKVWPTSRPEPTATDPAYTGTATVPVRSGQAGWYAGHVPSGTSIHMASLVRTP